MNCQENTYVLLAQLSHIKLLNVSRTNCNLKKKEKEKRQRKIFYRKEAIKIKEAILVANRYSTIIFTLSNYIRATTSRSFLNQSEKEFMQREEQVNSNSRIKNDPFLTWHEKKITRRAIVTRLLRAAATATALNESEALPRVRPST